MHTPGFEFALAYHRADLRRHADDHRTAAHRAGELARPRFSRRLRALVMVAGGRRPATTTALAATMAEAQPCPP